MEDIFTILLVEDSDDDALLFQRALRVVPKAKLVWHAHDGDEAVNYLAGTGPFGDRIQHPFPDMLVLDLKMPNRNGFEVLEWLDGKFPQLKVGVLSSSELPEDIRRSEALGAHLYQPKTTDPEIIERFVHWLGKLTLSEKKDQSKRP